MEFQIPLIFVALFVGASAVLVFVFKFGIKQKSYEEAMAEQRHHTQLLLGPKPKPKEKKSKKVNKKSKEKTDVVEEHESRSSDSVDVKPHVEFKEAVEEVPVEKVKPVAKPPKKEKVRPILLNKEKEVKGVIPPPESSPPPANSFDKLQPKDEFELLRSNSREDLSNVEGKKNVQQVKNETTPSTVLKENVVPSLNTNAPSNGIVANTGKEKKKKKSEFNTLQQLAGDANGPSVSILLNLVRKAELSRSEVQILIDLLLNKQHEAPAIVDEWSEGKSDPVQKLKKQLAEKEKQLVEEQEAATSAQAKLREIRSEFQAEKSQLTQKLRRYEEMHHDRQLEYNNVRQQLQQYQNQSKDEALKNQKLREEIAAMQIQRQHLEMRLAQASDAEVVVAQLQNDLQEIHNVNAQLQMEIRNEKECYQNHVIQFQKELEQKNERNRHLEEARNTLERELEKKLKDENDIKSEISHLKSAIQQQYEENRRVEHTKKQYFEELQKHKDELQKHKDDSTKLINSLKNELVQVEEEKTQLQATQINGSVQDNNSKQRDIDILNLNHELEFVKSQLAKAENNHDVELTEVNGLVEKLRKELEEERRRVEEQRNKNNERKSEVDIQKEFLQRLFPELKEIDSIKSEKFQTESEKIVRKHMDDLQNVNSDSKTEIDSLKSQLEHYRVVLDKTETILKKLQEEVSNEEIKWRNQVQEKTTEIEKLKKAHDEKLRHLGAQAEEEGEDSVGGLELQTNGVH